MSNTDFTQKQILDALCDKFEDDWTVDQRSRIPNYLKQVEIELQDSPFRIGDLDPFQSLHDYPIKFPRNTTKQKVGSISR